MWNREETCTELEALVGKQDPPAVKPGAQEKHLVYIEQPRQIKDVERRRRAEKG